MNVLVIPSWYPSGEDKLMGIYHKEFTEALNNNGINANILFIEQNRLTKPISYLFKKKKEIINETNYSTYLYHMINMGPISYKWQLKRYVKKLKKAFKNYLKTNKKPDIIHAQVTLPAGYAACILGKMYNIPVVVTEHYSKFETYYTDKLLKEYSKFVFDNSTYSTVSHYMKDIVLKYTNDCYIIPNLVDTELFDNDIIERNTETFNLVSVSSLRIGKGIDTILKAINLVRDKINIHLDIIGDGFCENYYKRICTELNLDDHVNFLGRKTKQEIANILQGENALIIGSELETFAIPGVEAMASGLPVITTNCLGPTEYVNDKTGVICEVNNPDDMAKAIMKLYNNYSNYNSNYIRKQAYNYSSTKVIERANSIYTSILKKKSD